MYVVETPLQNHAKRSISFPSLKVLQNVTQKFINNNIGIKTPRKFFVINIDERLKNWVEKNFEIKKK